MYANCKNIQNRSKRIASNTLVLFARMLIITFVNLYTVRWVLAGLGTEDYGIFNAVAGVVTASTCISSVLALSTQRFYSFAMGKGESDRLKEIFSVSLNIVVLIALVLLVLFEIVGPWLISTQLTIPVERMEAAGEITVIRPQKPVTVDRIERDIRKLTDLYEEGYACAAKYDFQ